MKPNASNSSTEYPDHFVDRLEIIWGEGFLSPGGAAEVKEIVKGLDLSAATVLDIGCGTGGVDIVLVRDLNAAHVIATDVEPALLDRARQRVAKSGMADRIEFRLVEPGPLEWPDSSFDIVFSKDSMVHIPDKDAMFREILRVLRPGGVLAASDWLCGENAATSPEWVRFRELGHLSLSVATARETELAMQSAGFSQVSTRDRNAWYALIAEKEVDQLEGPLRDSILQVADEEIYEHWLNVRRALRDSVRVGALRPTHLRGCKR